MEINKSHSNFYKFEHIQVFNNRPLLTNKFTDYSNIFLLPSISLFGIITNFLSICISNKLNKKKLINLFIFVDSILNFLLCLLSIFLPFIRCGSLCPFGYTYAAKVYELYFFSYLKHCFLLLSQVLQFIMSLNRLLAFSKKKHFQISARSFKIAIPIIFSVSLAAQSVFYLSNRRIKKFGLLKKSENSEHEYLYRVELKELDVSVKFVFFIINLLDSTVFYLIIFITDMVIILLFRKFDAKKQRIMSILPARRK